MTRPIDTTKSRACAVFLGDPGEAVVIEMCDEIDAIRAEVVGLKAELAKRDEPLTDEQAEQAFAIAKTDGAGECDTLALGMQCIDAAIRRVRGES